MTDGTGPKHRAGTGSVFIVLALLTVLEYVIGVRVRHSLLLILPIVLVMAALILIFVMDIRELRGGGRR